LVISEAICAESGVEVMDDELSHAAIITGFRVIFFRIFINGESNKNATRKNERKRKDIKNQTCFLLSSLLLLFLKYINNATPQAANIAAVRKINQNFMPNEINLLCFS
jgi:hypothetical protein